MFLFGKKNRYVFKWTSKINSECRGKIVLHVTSTKLHEKMWRYNRPHNDPKSFGYVPFALCIEGKIEEEEGFQFDKTQKAYALIPEPDLEESNIRLHTGDRIRLYLNKEGKCIKFERVEL